MSLTPAAGKTRRTLYAFALAYTALVATSLALVLGDVNERYPELARSEARSHFDEIVALRAWAAANNGVYATVSAQLQPNPYLKDPLRDLTTAEGPRLTKLNPAYLTRLVAEEIANRNGVRIHLTSLRPLRPANGPDPWEAAALAASERTGRPTWATLDENGAGTFRYLDVLRVEQPCLRCHAQQGYRLGDVRGGISVTLPYAPFAQAAHRERLRIAGAHGLFLALGLGLLWVLGRRLVANVVALQNSLARVRTLEGFLPICMHCKKIRKEGGAPDVQGDWEQLEEYIGNRTETQFSHGICPECLAKYYPDDTPEE